MKRLSRIVGILGLLTGIAFVLSVTDGFVSSLRKPKREFSVLPGQTLNIVEKAPAPIEDPRSISFSSSCGSIRTAVIEIRGRLWRGRIEIPSDMLPNRCTVSIIYPGYEGTDRIYHIKIFPTEKALLASSYSFFEKWTGLNPWIITAITSSLMMILIITSYLVSPKTGSEQKSSRYITNVVSKADRVYVTFPHFEADEIEPGRHLALMDDKGNIIGLATVLKINGSMAMAEAAYLKENLKPSEVSLDFEDVRHAARTWRAGNVGEAKGSNSR